MASFYGCSNFFGKYLPLLGFQDSTNILDNKELFVVPNKDAFQKVRLHKDFFIVSTLIFLCWWVPSFKGSIQITIYSNLVEVVHTDLTKMKKKYF